MAAKFVQRTLTSSEVPTLGTKQVIAKYFVCSPSEMTIVKCGTNAPSNWPNYGTNASFLEFSTTVMTAFHLANNNSVHDGGWANMAKRDDKTTRMDYMQCKSTTSGSTTTYALSMGQRLDLWPDVGLLPSGVKIAWAIGGFDLMAGYTYADSAALKSAYDTRFKATPNAFNGNITESQWLPVYASSRGRTLIGYKSQTEVIFGLFIGTTSPAYNSGPTVFESHKIMKYLGCTSALLLDGGGSCKAKWKNANGTNATSDGESGRSVQCQLALTSAAASSCNWSGTP